MRFNGICIVSEDIQRLREFYTDVLQAESEGDSGFVLFSVEGAMLSLFSAKGMEEMAPDSTRDAGCGSYTIEFQVEDVDQEYERLTEMKVPIVKPPTTQPWGRRSVWFSDPDGNIVNFYVDVDIDQ